MKCACPSASICCPCCRKPLQDRLWNARLTQAGVEVHPVYLGERTPETGVIATPDGPLSLRWKAPDKLDVPPGAACIVVDDGLVAAR